MPEGHTIRAIGNHWETYRGDTFAVSSPSGRVRTTGLIDGRVLVGVATHGKHLFLGFEGDRWLHIHLGRFGKFHLHTGALMVPADNVRLRLVGQHGWVDLVGPITCEVLTSSEREERLVKLGDDPLDVAVTGDRARAAIQRSKRPIGVLLMDQTVIAGIGNIYRAEVLWRNRVSPYRPGTAIDDAIFAALWSDTRELLKAGVRDYGTGKPTHTFGVPMPDGSNPIPEIFGKRNRTWVYQRQGLPCARCGTSIVETDMAGRNLFFCPVCQEV